MSRRGLPWTELEVEAVVADYFEMLAKELRGETFNKTEHRRRLKPLLAGRSDSSIERKHQNVSAVMIELGQPYVDGYKPLGNYQQLLFEVVAHRLRAQPALLAAVAHEVIRDADVPSVDDVLARLVDRPKPPRVKGSRGLARDSSLSWKTAPIRNHLLLEAQNQTLGDAGERFILNYERARLVHAGADRLAHQVEHVAVTRGDHEGYDVLSFEPDGQERLIEVKTTGFGALTPFFVSANQLRTSQANRELYQVYRVFGFRKEPHFFSLPGSIAESCSLDPTEYRARPQMPPG